MGKAKGLIVDLLGFDPSTIKSSKLLTETFFDRLQRLSFLDLKQVHDFVAGHSVTVRDDEGRDVSVPAAIRIEDDTPSALRGNGERPFLLLVQTHGNEPAGLSGILLALTLSEARMLDKPLYAVIGNNRAAAQYFKALEAAPHARQETRDQFRPGVDEDGRLLRDLNRIPPNFRELDPADPYIARVHQLFALTGHISAVLDIHTARGDMVCITDNRDDSMLQYSPIRSVFTHMLEAIADHTSSITLKLMVDRHRPNVTSITGIEAGRHEDPAAIRVAAEFSLCQLYNNGVTSALPRHMKDDGQFYFYKVNRKITFGDLTGSDRLSPSDEIYPVRLVKGMENLPGGTEQIVVRGNDGRCMVCPVTGYRPEMGQVTHAVYQFEEMERVDKGQVVAVAVPSGIELSSPREFFGIFFSKAAALYSDPGVGPWPVKNPSTKLAYPCDRREAHIDFPRRQTKVELG